MDYREITIDAQNLNYRELNGRVRKIIAGNPDNEDCRIIINNVLGQRYIGDGMSGKAEIKIHGTPGNDLAAFMDGPEIEIFGNGQDGIGNTMNSGRIIIHGDSGDIMGYSMRGGEIYVRGNVGWRSGIHMKSYLDRFPVIVIGGNAGNFLGEYLAGGIIIVLGLQKSGHEEQKSRKSFYFEKFYFSGKDSIVGSFVGAGMHGGAIFLRGDIEDYKMGKEVNKMPVDDSDTVLLEKYILNFCSYFGHDHKKIISRDFTDFIKLAPYSHRPYGKLYAY